MTRRVQTCVVVPVMVWALVFMGFIAPSARASNASSVLSSTYNFDSYQISVKGTLAGYINSCSIASGYSTYYEFGSNSDNIYQAAFGHDATFAITFYEGHGNYSTLNGQTQYCIQNDSGGQVWDKDIFGYDYFGRSKFAFLWSCYSGDVIGRMGNNGVPVGMPYAWTHKDNNTMSSDGYTNATPAGFAFIGFNGTGPTLDYNDGQGYFFAAYFYNWTFLSGKTLHAALDHAAQQLFNCQYSSCMYRTGFTLDGESGKMVIYGDGNLQIGSASSTPPIPPCPLRGGGKRNPWN